eukprot:2132386-Rhodomonas_salina.4
MPRTEPFRSLLPLNFLPGPNYASCELIFNCAHTMQLWSSAGCHRFGHLAAILVVAIRCCPNRPQAIVKLQGNQFELQRPKTTLTKKFKFASVVAPDEDTRTLHSKAGVSSTIQKSVAAGESVTVGHNPRWD